jgi:DNA-binding SARP family transcriptional activator
VVLDGSKQRTTLAALLLYGDDILRDDWLVRLLWDAEPPATATAQIRTYMSRLRTRLVPHLEIERRHQGYVCRVKDAWVDYGEFVSLTADAYVELAGGNHRGANQRLRRALGLWRGTALSDVTPYLERAAGPEMEESRLVALEICIDSDLRVGHHLSLIPELTGLVARFPFRERFRAQLMMALYFCDRQVDAFAVYESGRRTLAEELGVDPGEALVGAHRAVLTGDPSVYPVRKALGAPIPSVRMSR